MSGFRSYIEEKVIPATTKLSGNKVIKSLTSAMMATMPLTLGTSIIAIIGNFPVASWTKFLAEIGVADDTSAIIAGTTSILAIFLSFLVAYYYAQFNNKNAITSGVLGLGAYLALMPQNMALEDGKILNVLQKSYLGSAGIFVAMLTGILVAGLYCFLEDKGFVIKFPESVPEMISKSLSPTFIAMIMFLVIFIVRAGFGMTSYGNVFDFINKVVAAPIMSFGSTPLALITIYAIGNLFWCFGIHPSALLSVYIPVFMTAMTGNIEAFQAGQPLPYLAFIIVYFYIMMGGTGSTLGLAFDMLFFSKSERFKALGKLAIVPNLFNINEPIIFGAPIIFNPVFMIPMVLVPFLNGGLALLWVKLGFYANFNPAIKMPWTMPAPVNELMRAGVWAAVAAIVTIIATAILYYPFFKYADKMACKEESSNA